MKKYGRGLTFSLKYNHSSSKKIHNSCQLMIIYKILSKNFIEIFPESIVKCSSLKVLSMSKNFLKHIPNIIHKLKSLEYLDLSQNLLKEISDGVFELNRLECLLLSRNDLSKVPDKASNLNLSYLDLSYNRITSISIHSRALCKIMNLNLSYNPIHTPPQNVIFFKFDANELVLLLFLRSLFNCPSIKLNNHVLQKFVRAIS